MSEFEAKLTAAFYSIREARDTLPKGGTGRAMADSSLGHLGNLLDHLGYDQPKDTR